MSNGLMGPPLPKTAMINKSLAPPDAEEKFVLTPQKIERGFESISKSSSF